MQSGAAVQVFSADDMCDALCGIIDDNGQMIADTDILSANDVVVQAGVQRVAVPISVPPADITNSFQRLLCIQPPGKGLSISHALCKLLWWELAAGAGIGFGDVFGMRSKGCSGDLALDVAARTEAGVNQFLLPEQFQRLHIIVDMLALIMDIPLPTDAEPVEIVNQVACKAREAAIEIDVFDAQQ